MAAEAILSKEKMSYPPTVSVVMAEAEQRHWVAAVMQRHKLVSYQGKATVYKDIPLVVPPVKLEGDNHSVYLLLDSSVPKPLLAGVGIDFFATVRDRFVFPPDAIQTFLRTGLNKLDMEQALVIVCLPVDEVISNAAWKSAYRQMKRSLYHDVKKLTGQSIQPEDIWATPWTDSFIQTECPISQVATQ
jgi:hypothetical protein